MPFRTKEEQAEYYRKYREANKEKLRLYERERNAIRRADPEYAAAQYLRKIKWRAENNERHLKVQREYENTQRRTNPQWRLTKNLRHRLRKALLGETLGISAVRDLGMPIPDFRVYLEARFQEGMTWENYGQWHVDHIKPLASFDLTDPDQVRVACHYTNLQPLWAEDNLKKGCR